MKAIFGLFLVLDGVFATWLLGIGIGHDLLPLGRESALTLSLGCFIYSISVLLLIIVPSSEKASAAPPDWPDIGIATMALGTVLLAACALIILAGHESIGPALSEGVAPYIPYVVLIWAAGVLTLVVWSVNCFYHVVRQTIRPLRSLFSR